MKKLTIRLSEKTHEDLVRIADGMPIQRYLERMIDEAIIRATEGLPAPRPARDVGSPEPVISRGSPSPSLGRFEKP